jgi:hypothetical protein
LADPLPSVDNVLALKEPSPDRPNQSNTKATVGKGKMKIITTWHCREILQGKEHKGAPREWLILAGPGEDVIFEVKTSRRPTDEPDQPATRH